ncbi:unnamed protein product [Mytilus coruscus]|uniref:protein-tyrosine-phosphatase n=1 Tax=Mytilus coruscus TaxID=42192 RepID=A0A6J8C1E3_MYTCO|nr:unnamed protein product [Mytilus coruscus]
MNSTNLDTGGQTVAIETASNLHHATTQQHKIKDKYLNLVDEYLLHGHMNILFEHVKYFDKVDFSKFAKGVKSSLSKNVAFWEHIGASKFIINTIKCYMIPFVNLPPPMKFRNNKSAVDNTDFVNEAVLELAKNRCVHEVPFQPFVVNPLSVAIQKSEKKRLILDLSELNLYVLKNKIKFEDWKVAQQFFKKDIYLIKFDLKSGYFHLDICKEQHTYLGFSWNGTFYCFSVLAFGLSSAPYIFTKCLRPMVKYWRENGVDIVLDDGLDIFSVGRWSSEILSPHQPLQNLAKCLPEFCLHSRAENTRKKYRYAFNNFCRWCNSFNLNSLPASDYDVSLYLIHLCKKHKSASIVEGAYYAISWSHKLAGFADPCNSFLCTYIKEGVHRSIGHYIKKCERYWPETVNEPMVVNNYIITMKEDRKHTVYVYRLLTVSNKNVKNVEEREIHHFHFTEWPDHGVPDSIKVVNFYRKVKSKACDQIGPMVVNCSAGIGRTGTFIAIDALYENGKKVGHINVMECIRMMRKDRMNMVQSYEQYEAIFEALLELFTVPDTSIPKKEFCQYISDQEQKKLPRNQKLYKLEFQRLEILRPVYPPSAFSAATSKENISKNSIKKIFPHNRYRPYTMSYARTRNDYINAVIIPGYTYDSKILVTQCPLEETVVDFWTMVYDHNSSIVVLLDKLNTERQEILEFKQFTILQDNSPNPEEFKLTLNHKVIVMVVNAFFLSRVRKGSDDNYFFTTSKLNNDAMLPSNILLDLLKKVKECWEKQKSPITVVCSDGCSKSGVFVALKLIMEKMEIDDEIDVFQVVRTMQVRRPEFFTEYDQYEYCYKCIKEYLENDSVYANLK